MQRQNFEEIFKMGLSPGTASQYLWHLKQYEKFLYENDETLETVNDPGGSIRDYSRARATEG